MALEAGTIEKKTDAEKAYALDKLQALALVVKSGQVRAGHGKVRTSTGHDVEGTFKAPYWAGALAYDFRVLALGGVSMNQVPRNEAFIKLLEAEIQSWGWTLPPDEKVSLEPLISTEMERALEELFEGYRLFLEKRASEILPRAQGEIHLRLSPPVQHTVRVADEVRTVTHTERVPESNLAPVAPVRKEEPRPAARFVPPDYNYSSPPPDRSGTYFLVVTGFALAIGGGLAYFLENYESPEDQQKAERLLSTARSPLEVLCANAVPGKFTLVKGKDVLRDGKSAAFDLRLVENGAVIASIAGAVPESCLEGKLFANFTDFPKAQLIISAGQSTINPWDLSVREPELARYRFTPRKNSKPVSQSCPKLPSALPFPKDFEEGPYHGPSSPDVALHKNKGGETSIGWFYVNQGDDKRVKSPNCGGFLSDMAALEAMTPDEKVAHATRSKAGRY